MIWVIWPAGPSSSARTSWRLGSAGMSVSSMAFRPSCSSAARRLASIAWMPFTHSFDWSFSGTLSKARARLSIAGKMDSRSWRFAWTRNSVRSSSVRRLKFWNSAIARLAASVMLASSSWSCAIWMSLESAVLDG